MGSGPPPGDGPGRARSPLKNEESVRGRPDLRRSDTDAKGTSAVQDSGNAYDPGETLPHGASGLCPRATVRVAIYCRKLQEC